MLALLNLPPLYTVSMPGKRSQANLNRKPKSYLFTDTLVYTIAHLPLPPSTHVNCIQDRQGRLVHVRTVVAATCIKIKSPVAQRNDDLIACSVLVSVISFGVVFTIQPWLR